MNTKIIVGKTTEHLKAEELRLILQSADMYLLGQFLKADRNSTRSKLLLDYVVMVEDMITDIESETGI